MGSTSAGNSGILSGVFNFVSREFDSFITNATGSEPSTSQVLLDNFVDSDFSREASLVEGEAPVLRSFHNSKQTQSGSSAKNEREAKNSRRKRIKKVVASPEEDDLPSDCSRRSPKPQLSRSLRRRPSVSMPGSLFPRSPSTEPDADPFAVEKEQCVRFALHTSDPQSPQKQKSPKLLDGSASTSDPSRRHFKIVSSSVKTAVDKFHIGDEDADPSILLPSPKRSPHVLVSSRNLQSRRISNPISPSAVATKHKRKNHSVELFSDDCGDASGFLRVKGKEKELIASRGELYENGRCDNEAPALSVEQAEHDYNSDKIRIKMLEEEIERLKEELSKRSAPIPSGLERVCLPPPPPPPPPPPLLYKKILLDIPAATPESHLFASARASLKQAPAPVENPINPLIGRRAGQPTVGLAADKMAAFLNEMKTVRLRKVSERFSGDNSATLPPERFNTQSALRGSSSLQRPQPTIPLLKASNIADSESENRMGEKRKRNMISIRDDADPHPKRRLCISSADSSLAADSSLDSSGILTDGTASSTCLHPPLSKAAVIGRTWPSGSLTEAPTPSLCSDNDIDISLDDQAPSTPPAPAGPSAGPSRKVYRFNGNGIPAEDESSRQIHPRPNIFDKRIPSSPFPDKSPRRPPPPSRISRPTSHLISPSRQEDHSEEEDPLSLTFSTFPSTTQRQTTSQPSTRSPDAHSLSPLTGSSRARRRSVSQVNRRRTLDEELRDLPLNYREELEDETLFTGVGTRSKGHGFLAHGGAGGAPVFMDVGQVEGAEEEDSYASYAGADAEYLPSYSTRGRNRRR